MDNLNTEKVQIAKDYLSLHHELIRDEYSNNDNDEWISVFNNIIGGAWGDCRPVDGFHNQK